MNTGKSGRESRPNPYLSYLVQHLPGGARPVARDVLVNGVAMDSRRVEPGNLFVALSGERTDGHNYIPDALQRGASAVVGTQPLTDIAVPYFQVGDGRQALAYLAGAFYGFPSRELGVIGVTGTDGKTTTVSLINQIMQSAGFRVGMISTVNAVIGEQTLDTGFHVTTPEAPDVQRYLAQMVAAGLEYVILEATSHGLAQHRLTSCDFDMGVVTNITHEHLDYHGTFEAYRAAKSRLFISLGETSPKRSKPPRAAVLNRDDASYRYLSRIAPVPQLSYGFHAGADVRAVDVSSREDSLQFTAVGRDFQGKEFCFLVESHLTGQFNVANCLAAVALTRGVLGLDDDIVQGGIIVLSGIPGRMETVDLGQGFIAIVDFAHTPSALRNALASARRLTSGRVIAVFGSAGLRDRAKRRLMAEISADLADLTVLTAEDPRTESLQDILHEMAAGLESRAGVEGGTYWRILDRREAIRFAVEQARPDDLVIVCGKGHEKSMCFGETEYPWDDRVALGAALAEHLGVEGPQMPYLPSQG